MHCLRVTSILGGKEGKLFFNFLINFAFSSKTKMYELLNIERAAFLQYEQSVSGCKEFFSRKISEVSSQIASLQQEEILLKEELESVQQNEQAILAEMKELENISTESTLERNEKHERILNGLQDRVNVLEKEIEKSSSDNGNRKCELEHDLMELHDMNVVKDNAIANLKLSVDKLEEESKYNENMLIVLLKDKESKEASLTALNKEINMYTQEIDLRNKCDADIRNTIERERLMQLDTNNQISDLNCKLQELQTDRKKVILSHENSKQVSSSLLKYSVCYLMSTVRLTMSIWNPSNFRSRFVGGDISGGSRSYLPLNIFLF